MSENPHKVSEIHVLILSCSHRPSLLKYHNRHLRLGESATAPPSSPLASTGSRIHSAISFTALQQQALAAPPASQGWQLTTLASTSAEEKLEVDIEIEKLEQLLGTDVAQWESRLHDINKELSGKA